MHLYSSFRVLARCMCRESIEKRKAGTGRERGHEGQQRWLVWVVAQWPRSQQLAERATRPLAVVLFNAYAMHVRPLARYVWAGADGLGWDHHVHISRPHTFPSASTPCAASLLHTPTLPSHFPTQVWSTPPERFNTTYSSARPELKRVWTEWWDSAAQVCDAL